MSLLETVRMVSVGILRFGCFVIGVGLLHLGVHIFIVLLRGNLGQSLLLGDLIEHQILLQSFACRIDDFLFVLRDILGGILVSLIHGKSVRKVGIQILIQILILDLIGVVLQVGILPLFHLAQFQICFHCQILSDLYPNLLVIVLFVRIIKGSLAVCLLKVLLQSLANCSASSISLL